MEFLGDLILLLYFLHSIQKEYALTIVAAHLDHEWRSDSAHDLLFCSVLCKKLGIPFVSKKASELTINPRKNGSKEAFARTLRRHYLESVCKEYQADVIALGHHHDDQQETFFIRLIRGATLSGLASMKPKNGLYIRPLLPVSKKEILDYLHEHSLDYRIDSTNSSDLYLRNRIRATILPAFARVDPRFDATIMHTIESLQETEDFLTELTATTFTTITTQRAGTYYISISKLLSLHSVLQNRIIMHWLIIQQVPFVPTHALLEEIVRFLNNNKSNKHTILPSWSIIKQRTNAFIVKI